MFFKIIVPIKFANFPGKHLCRSLFNKVPGPQNRNFIKKRFQHRFFPVKFAKFLRTPCFTEHLEWLFLKVSGFQCATLIKKRLWQRCFSVSFAKFLRTSFLLTEHLHTEHFFYRAPQGNCPQGNCYFMYKLQNFNYQIQ